MSIYVIKTKHGRFFKVGQTQNQPSSRLSRLAEDTFSPFELKYFFKSRSLRQSRAIEAYHHRELKKLGLHSRGEWFKSFKQMDEYFLSMEDFEVPSKRMRLFYEGNQNRDLAIKSDLVTMQVSICRRYARFVGFIPDCSKTKLETAIPFKVHNIQLLLGISRYFSTSFVNRNHSERLKNIKFALNEDKITNGWFRLTKNNAKYLYELQSISNSFQDVFDEYVAWKSKSLLTVQDIF